MRAQSYLTALRLALFVLRLIIKLINAWHETERAYPPLSPSASQTAAISRKLAKMRTYENKASSILEAAAPDLAHNQDLLRTARRLVDKAENPKWRTLKLDRRTP